MIEQYEAISRILQKIEKPLVYIENDNVYVGDQRIDVSDNNYLDTVESVLINILMGSLGRALDAERKHHEILISLDN